MRKSPKQKVEDSKQKLRSLPSPEKRKIAVLTRFSQRTKKIKEKKGKLLPEEACTFKNDIEGVRGREVTGRR